MTGRNREPRLYLRLGTAAASLIDPIDEGAGPEDVVRRGMTDVFGTIKEGTGPGMVVRRRVLEKDGAIEEGTCPVGLGLEGTDGEMEMIEDGMIPV